MNHACEFPLPHPAATGEAPLEIAYNSLPCGVIRCLDDKALTLTYFNDAFAAYTGYTRQEICGSLGSSLRALIAPEDAARAEREILHQLGSGQRKEIQYRLLRKDGSYLWVLDRGIAIARPDDSREFLCVLMDNNDQREKLVTLRAQAEHDPLTGLYNRAAFEAFVKSYLACQPGRQAALFILDIDDFKQTNDSFGHLFGDSTLTHLACQLKAAFRTTDLIARIGGDELAVFMEDISGVDHAKAKSRDLISQIAQSRQSLHLTCSLGAACYPHNGRTYAELFAQADCALYHAKALGKCQALWADELSVQTLCPGENRSVTQIDTQGGLLAQANAQMTAYAFHVLYEAEPFDAGVSQVLSRIAQTYDLSRISVWESSSPSAPLRCTYEWCAPGDMAAPSDLPTLSNKDLQLFHAAIKAQGSRLLIFQDAAKASPAIRRILTSRQVYALVACCLQIPGQALGFICFDECRAPRFWKRDLVEILRELARILEIFLVRRRLSSSQP